MLVRGYIIDDATYPIGPYLQKNWKTHNAVDVRQTQICFWYELKESNH
jgi:hypothetical protein